MRFFTPPEGKELIPFQEEGIVRAYLMLTEGRVPAADVQWEMGLGKSVLTMAVSALLFEDDLVDTVVVVAEKNKVRDWAEDDFPSWTSLYVERYTGTPDRRARIRAKDPQVLVTTYETGRVDICNFAKARKAEGRAIAGPGPLAQHLAGKRVLVVFDESTRLRNRSSRTHLAWNYLLNRWLGKKPKGKKTIEPAPMAMSLTGTKIESRPEDHYNVNRIIASRISPKVEDFERDYVAEFDEWSHQPSRWKNLSSDSCETGVTPLSLLYADMTLRKRKQDPDVIGWFPAKVENPSRFIDMVPSQRDFYEAVRDALDPEDALAGMTTLRQVANAPESLLRSPGAVSRAIVEAVGEDTLRSMGSAKTDAMVEWLAEAGDQQAVIFTFFGQSVLPVLHDRLRDEGYRVSINHGQMSDSARQVAQGEFKAGQTQVFLTSDAGARGLNLGVGSVLLHYELPLLHSIYSQRSDRIHRADSVHPSVTVDSFIARGTLDEVLFNHLIRRNLWSDAIMDDNRAEEGAVEAGYLTAKDRRDLWEMARSL